MSVYIALSSFVGNKAMKMLARFRGMLVVGSLAVAGPAAAQSNDELNGSFQFNFHTPGARSLGMGRAFTGRADDATAAFANPAGLQWLQDPEASFEVRYSRFETSHVDGGRANGAPTGLGIDTVDHPVFSETDRSTTGLSFLSVVYPLGKEQRWRLAVYRHELANFKAAIDRSEGVFFALPRERPGRVNHGRVQSVQAELDLDVVNYGLSASYRISDQFWAGLGAGYYEFQLRSLWEGFRQTSGNPADPTEVSFGPSVFSGENSGGTRLQRGDDHDIGLLGGLMWRTLDRAWTAGLVYRQGPEFDFESTSYIREQNEDGTFSPAEPCGQFASPPRVPCGSLATDTGGRGVFEVPSVYSAGLTYSPGDSRWLFSFEYDRLTYSDLEPSINVLAIANNPEVQLSEFEIKDGNEYHLGAQRRFQLGPNSVAVRVGAWLDPAHQLEFNDRPPLSTVVVDGVVKPTNDAVRLEARFPGGDDEIHWTAGVGLALERFRVESAVDVSDREVIVSFSGVVYLSRDAK